MSAMTFKRWLILITFVALAVLIYAAWHDIVSAFQRLESLNIWVLLATVPLLFLFYFAMAKFFSSFFEAVQAPVKLKTVFASMLELNFVNHVFPSGGISGFSYLTLRLRPFGISTAKTTFAQISRFGFAFLGQVALMFVSLFLLAIEDRASTLIVLLVSILVLSLVAWALFGLFVISKESRGRAVAGVVARFLNRVIHIFRPKHPETISLSKVELTLSELHADYVMLRQNIGKMRWAFVWINVATLIEMGLLYTVFLAHGEWVNPGAVIIAFAIANTAGLIVALPGGIGVFETLMTTAFIAMGIPPGLALSVTLIYRVIILLLSLVTGGFLYHRAIGRMGENATSIHR